MEDGVVTWNRGSGSGDIQHRDGFEAALVKMGIRPLI